MKSIHNSKKLKQIAATLALRDLTCNPKQLVLPCNLYSLPLRLRKKFAKYSYLELKINLKFHEPLPAVGQPQLKYLFNKEFSMYPPQSYDAERANRVSFQIVELQGSVKDQATRVVTIDASLKENIALIATIAERQLAILKEFMNQSPEKRDIHATQIKFQEVLKTVFFESVENFRRTLETRKSYVANGKEVKLTEEKKLELLQEYQNVVGQNLEKYTQEVTLKGDLEKLQAILEEKIRLQKEVCNQAEATAKAFTSKLWQTLKDLKTLATLRASILEDPPKDMWRACEVGSLAHIRFYIHQVWFCNVPEFLNRQDDTKRDLSGRKFKVFTALDYAVYREQDEGGLRSEELPSPEVKLEIVHLLLSRGANPCIPNEVGYQSLHWAAKVGDVKIVKELLDHKTNPIDINCRGEYGRTPLHMAVYNRHLAVAEVLLSRGADVNALTTDREDKISPIFYAVEQLNLPMILALLKDPRIILNIKNLRQFTPLRIAIAHGDVTIASLIRTHVNWTLPKDTKDPDHVEQLH
ncbi:MAG: ankyrin repeat domain-containing protein [Parachlamydia sp.]|nr:ankyrin repeat domain-containing protein [Parachlamydia sp.]